ncbi:MAG: PilT/PilU family type 4a pilus ATPase [Thermoanaerobaculales bacterium]|nr:PilT/PilU family type 4a pilus ATPase [Thermoanaerobaculales bacterium]
MKPSFENLTVKEALKILSGGSFADSQERDELLEIISAAPDTLKPADIVWMAFRPDRILREACGRLLTSFRTPETIDLFLAQSRGQRDPAIRAAALVLFSLRIPGMESSLLRLAESNDLKQRTTAHQFVLSCPPAPALERLFWKLASVGDLGSRLRYLDRLAEFEISESSLNRWKLLVSHEDSEVRDRALRVIVQCAAEPNIDLLVANLSRVRQETQEAIIAAIVEVAKGKGPDFAEHILPLMASGNATTRSAVVSILLGMPDQPRLIRRYLEFSKSLAGWTRDRALENMRALGTDMVDSVLELLKDPDMEVRFAALLLIGSNNHPGAVEAIVPLLKDDDWWLRITAAETLGLLGDPRAGQALTELLGDPEARWAAIDALGQIGDDRALPALAQLLKSQEVEVRIEVLMALKHFDHPQIAEALKQVANSDPNQNVQLRALSVLKEIRARKSAVVEGEAEIQARIMKDSAEVGEPKVNAMLRATRKQKASDLHLTVGQAPIVRVAGRIVRVNSEPLTAEQIQALLIEVLSDEQKQRLQDRNQLDLCHYIPGSGRYRANVFLDRCGLNAAFRVIPDQPPTFEEFGLPEILKEVLSYHQGLILVCGPSGSGKSTTLAALVNLFNESRFAHIISLEDPVEFVHPFKSSLINQREVGRDSESYARALRAALREDPDVIVIGELRDTESISLALTAAETGHVVLGTLNATNASRVVDRIISSFSAKDRPAIRTSLAETLRFAVAQHLLPAKGITGQVACFEILKNTPSVVNLIREGKTIQIPSVMQIGQTIGMRTHDAALRELLERDLITLEVAYRSAISKKEFADQLPAGFFDGGAPGGVD